MPALYYPVSENRVVLSIFGTPQRPQNSNIWKWTIVTNRDKSLGVPPIFRQSHMSQRGVSNTLHPPEQGRPQLSRGHRDCHAAGHSLWIWVWRLIGLRLGLRYFLHSFCNGTQLITWLGVNMWYPKSMMNPKTRRLWKTDKSISVHQMGSPS